MFLLDTNVVSELRLARGGRANPGVVAWAAEAPAELLFLSVVTIYELELGVRLAERSDTAKGSILREWLDDSVLPAFADRILPVSVDIVRVAPGFSVPDPAPYRDALIAATALVHGLTVVTRNVSDFERCAGIAVVNPYA